MKGLNSMKKIISILLIILSVSFTMLFTGCKTDDNAVENTDKKTYTINEQQAEELMLLSQKIDGNMSDVTNLFPEIEVNLFETEQDGTFSYTTFDYNESTIALIYNNSDDICGWLYYSEPISLAELNEAKTLEDVQKIDSTLTNNAHGFNENCAITLTNRRGYSLVDTETGIISTTTHFTEDGLFAVQYSQPLDSDNPAENEILSIERIDDEVYNTVHALATNKAVG